MRVILILSLFISLRTDGISQEKSYLIGLVVNESNSAIENALVSIPGLGFDYTTSLGEFRLEVPDSYIGQEICLRVHKTGYEPFDHGNFCLVVPSNSVTNPAKLKMRRSLAKQLTGEKTKQTNNIKTITAVFLEGGNIKLDIIAFNRSSDDQVFNSLKVKVLTPFPLFRSETNKDGIQVFADYCVRFNLKDGGHKVVDPVLLPSQQPIRMIVNLQPKHRKSDLEFLLTLKDTVEFRLAFIAEESLITETSKLKVSLNDLINSSTETLELYRQFARSNPSNVFGIKRLINALEGSLLDHESKLEEDEHMKKLKEELKTLYLKWIDLVPNNIEPYQKLIMLEERHESIIDLTRQAVFFDSTIVNLVPIKILSSYLEQGRSHLAKNDLSQAQLLLEEAFSFGLAQSTFSYELAKLHSLKGKCEMAVKYLGIYRETQGRINILKIEIEFSTLKDCRAFQRFISGN